MDGVETDERRFKFLAALRIVGRARLQRGGDLVAHALEADGENLAERRHVVHVVAERSAAERQTLALTRPLPLEGGLRHQPLLLIELAAELVDETRGTLPAPAAVHARLEVERALLEEKRHEVAAHREIARAPYVERIVVRMFPAKGREILFNGLIARRRTRILHRIALEAIGIERAQLRAEGRVVDGGRRRQGSREQARGNKRTTKRRMLHGLQSRVRQRRTPQRDSSAGLSAFCGYL